MVLPHSSAVSRVGRWAADRLVPRAAIALAAIAAVAIALVLLAAPGAVRSQPSQPEKFELTARAAILIDAGSGKVLFEKNADEQMLKLDDEFLISENAWRRGGAASGGSTMYADVNSKVKLSDLIQGVAIQSANDACIAIAEGMAGSESAFAERMTRRARELGAARSTLANATGLPDPNHRMTARDLATLARYLIERFPEYYQVYSQPEFTWNNITQPNRNPLLGAVAGADGVKTGFIRESGYGLVGSVKRDGRRLILASNGFKSIGARREETIKLIEWGFRQFQSHRIYASGDTIGKARVWGGERQWVKLVADQEVKLMLSADEQQEVRGEVVYTGPLKAPVRKGEQVGSLRFMVKGNKVAEVPLLTGDPVEENENMWWRAFDTLVFMIMGG